MGTAIRIECPRCQQPLAVPARLAGGYANCPRCAGRFFVPKVGPAIATAGDVAAAVGPRPLPDALPASAATSAAIVSTTPSGPAAPAPLRNPNPVPPPVIAPPPGAPLRAVGEVAQPQAAVAIRPTTAGMSPPPPVSVPPPPGRKVAKFISAEAAPSMLKPTADGQFPQLQLEDAGRSGKAEAKSKAVHPLLLTAALCFSLLMSVLLALTDFDDSAPDAKQKEDARQAIRDKFFGGGNVDRSSLKPYQVYLREAQRAHDRRDLKSEREYYRKVLKLLHNERGEGVAGSHERDGQLEAQISTLLSE